MAAAQASLLQSFPFRAAVFAACVLLIPLLPSPQQPPPAGGDGGGRRGEAFVAKVWELLHLLVVGIAVSYGLFSRRNDAGGRRGDEKDAAAAAKGDNVGYVSQMIHDSLVFDDGGDVGGEVVRSSWSAIRRPDEPVVVVATAGDTPLLSLPVRTLKPQPEFGGDGGEARRRRSSHDMAGDGNETVLRSPIPWRSRSGRLDASPSSAAARSSPSPSPKRLSPASSLTNETLAKASEDYSRRRISPYKQSSPPAPPPPPPPFLIHGYHPPAAADRRTPAARSFKEELHDLSTRGRGFDDYSSSSAKPRISIDGSSSSSSSTYYPIGKSVRTIRGGGGREASQIQSQEQPDVTVAGDGSVNLHGSDSDDPYGGYRAYQSIPKFQYERGSSDPILGNVTVSSESSDDDDAAGGEVSTRGSSPRRESSPEVDENEVDKKAEEFIARFREQIRLQRIESIKKSAGPRGVKHGK